MNIKNLLISLLYIFIFIAATFCYFLFRNPSYHQIKKYFVTGKDISPKDSFLKINIHYIIDFIPKLFSNGESFPDGVKTDNFIEHLKAIDLRIPEWKGEGLYEVSAKTKEGNFNPAFLVYHWYSDAAPTIIYNHGAFEYPFDENFRKIFKEKELKSLKVNLIIIRTPFHGKKNGLIEGTATLSKFLATMAVSTKLTEDILRIVKSRGVKTVEVAGISLGGVVCNRHHVIYNSADFYVPIIAGTAYEKLFLSQKSGIDEAERNRMISKNLNFSCEWASVNNDNVFPICAKYDDYCKLNEQAPSYGNCKIEIWETGHLTTFFTHKALKYALLKHISPDVED